MPLPVGCDLTPLTQSGSKVIDRIANILFSNPERKIQRKKVLQDAQNEVDYHKIISGECKFDGENLISPLNILGCEYNQLLKNEQQQEIYNFLGNICIALEVGKSIQNKEVANGNIDPDWFARWRREAKVIRNKTLQHLWGRILVEEAKSPQSISYRTLDILKNLTQNEAQLFAQMGRWEVGGVLPCNNGKFLNFTYKDYMTLTDAGLLVSPENISVLGNLDRNGNLVVEAKNFSLVIEPHRRIKDKLILLSGVKISSAGIDILNISDLTILNQSEIETLKAFVQEKLPSWCRVKTIRIRPRLIKDDNIIVRTRYRSRKK